MFKIIALHFDEDEDRFILVGIEIFKLGLGFGFVGGIGKSAGLGLVMYNAG